MFALLVKLDDDFYIMKIHEDEEKLLDEKNKIIDIINNKEDNLNQYLFDNYLNTHERQDMRRRVVIAHNTYNEQVLVVKVKSSMI